MNKPSNPHRGYSKRSGNKPSGRPAPWKRFRRDEEKDETKPESFRKRSHGAKRKRPSPYGEGWGRPERPKKESEDRSHENRTETRPARSDSRWAKPPRFGQGKKKRPSRHFQKEKSDDRPSLESYFNQQRSKGERKARRHHDRLPEGEHKGRGRSGRSDERRKRPDLLVKEGAFGVLDTEIQRALGVEGYARPTPIQEQCIPLIVDGHDVIGSAQTGTGKTAAFVLPMLHRLVEQKQRSRPHCPRAVVLAPTRELASQISDNIRQYGRFLGLRQAVIFGGVGQFPQVRALQKGVDLLVATPGRMLDLMGQGHLNLGEVQFFVLDEMDRMLDMGFAPDLEKIRAKLPGEKQTLMFSATFPNAIKRIARDWVQDPKEVMIDVDEPTVEAIEQQVMFVKRESRYALLQSILSQEKVKKAVVFIQRKFAATKLAEKLRDKGLRSVSIHGNKSQPARSRALEDFRRGKVNLLIATDVAARGIDVDDITHVINFDLPTDPETYVHRSGRTGRAGASGVAISFCISQERFLLAAIEKHLGSKIPVNENHPFHCHVTAEIKPRHRHKPQGGGRGFKRLGNKRSQGPRGKSRFARKQQAEGKVGS